MSTSNPHPNTSEPSPQAYQANWYRRRIDENPWRGHYLGKLCLLHRHSRLTSFAHMCYSNNQTRTFLSQLGTLLSELERVRPDEGLLSVLREPTDPMEMYSAWSSSLGKKKEHGPRELVKCEYL